MLSAKEYRNGDAVFMEQIADHEALVMAFIVAHMAPGAMHSLHALTGGDPLAGCQRRICREFGVALNLARTLAPPPAQRRCQYLERALMGWPEEMRRVLLQVAAGTMRIEQAAVLPALPLSQVRSRILALSNQALKR